MNRKLLVGTVLLGVGSLAVVFGWPRPTAAYARSVSDFVAHPSYDRSVRVFGTLVPGSLLRRADGCEYRFTLRERSSVQSDSGPIGAGPELAVRYRECVIPDDFCEVAGVDVEVTVEGQQCAGCHHFDAAYVHARCSRTYPMHCTCGVAATDGGERQPAPPTPK